MKRILAISLAFAISLVPTVRPRASLSNGSVDRYLVVGFDDAAENTDVIALVSYQPSSNRLTLLQIPRDTYYDFGGVQNKINQLYPYVLAGRDGKAAREEAMMALKDAVSSVLGVSIDRYVAVSIDGFAAMIDRIGGVEMKLDREISFRDEETGELHRIGAGGHLLKGKEASAFVRYRLGYASGDLGRLDAQKVFISALLRKFGSGLSAPTIISILSGLRSGVVTDLSLPHALRLGIRFASYYKKTDIRYLTLPGEPCIYRGISYYVANRASSAEAISALVCFSRSCPTFDPNGRLVFRSSREISEIYDRSSIDYRVYTDAELRLR